MLCIIYKFWRLLNSLRKLMPHGYCFICRLCQDIVLQKAEVAEILFPNVMVNLAGRKNLDFDLCKLISSKVIFLMIEQYPFSFHFLFYLAPASMFKYMFI